MAVSVVEQAALDGAENFGVVDYFKEVASNRSFYIIQLPKIALELSEKVAGFASATLSPITTGLGRLTDAEDFVFFLQDLASLPEATGKVCKKITGWINGSTTFMELANQVRKLAAHLGSTLGDYAGSVRALRGLNVAVGRLDVVSDKVGSCGSLLGSSSKLYDIVTGGNPSKTDTLKPSLQSVKRPLEESKNFWDAGIHVSIIALSLMGLTVGMAAYPAATVLVSGGLLGSRMISYYRSCQLNAMNASHPQMKQAKI
ncbi:hypothetical protein COB11_00355 [Candidatus Aerophobetes bacterium]|uniref:Uncharacterized protein n=1 Tax=Aerophobetes bacterium TaxID=2030807 RepID=A0A2A4YMN3_UNCAE|nr:MAG: hypothetical protein COB11_00355 [Candidatus Aerophobetes bacterium]